MASATHTPVSHVAEPLPRPERVPFHMTGNFAPVTEEVTLYDLPVKGKLPPDLFGTYVRNGPNPQNGPAPIWFLGQGMLHGVRLEGGRARWYRNRAIRASTTSNTSVVRHGGKILALVETSPPFEVSEELESLGPTNFDGCLNGGMTAHPKVCPVTGDLMFFSYSLEQPYLHYYRASAGGALVQTQALAVQSPTYMHDFAITENYVLFLDLPVLFMGWRSPMPIRWSEKYGARIGVLRRDSCAADIHWFEIKPCTISHTVNAYEVENSIVLDVVRAQDLTQLGQFHRYTLNLRTNDASEFCINDLDVDFPRIDDRRMGRPYKYAYALELLNVQNGAPTNSVLRKFDLTTGHSITHDFGDGRVAGEAVFLPRCTDSTEDDGFAMTLVYDRKRNASDLVILDAADFSAPAIATVELPVRVPFGFHGNWFPDMSGPPLPT